MGKWACRVTTGAVSLGWLGFMSWSGAESAMILFECGFWTGLIIFYAGTVTLGAICLGLVFCVKYAFD